MGHSRPVRRRDLSRALGAAALTLSTLVAFAPILRNGFVNWDDPTVILDNAKLSWPAVLPWAFQTTLIGHYQPLAWLTWAAMKAAFGVSPAAFHAVSLAGHVVNALLVYLVALRLGSRAGLPATRRRSAAWIAAAAFALHPAAVEAVAWASALPYVLSLAVLLASLLAYLHGRRAVSLACYALSLLVRATAIGFALVLLALDLFPLARRRDTRVNALVLEKLPFAGLAAAAAFAEWRARDVATLQDVGIGARLTMAASAPFVYLGRTLLPLRLSPLDPLPIAPALDPMRLALGVAGVAAVTGAAWRLRRRMPALLVGWTAYLVLLAPVIGLAPSGIQATADRYLYLPLVVLAVGGGAAAVRLADRWPRSLVRPIAVGGLAIVAALGAVTWRQATCWRDSVALWTRAAEIDPHNDVATYNLAVALADAGREDEAIQAYQATLRLVPDHDLARQQLARLRASRAHAHASRGLQLLRTGRLEEAAVELRSALEAGASGADVPNALAYALSRRGDAAGAIAVLRRALADHPDDVNVEHNLARLLATSEDARVRDGASALTLARDVCAKTGNRDPRALDTLAAAYAATGNFDLARATAARAVLRARELGDAETAAEIAAHASRYR